MITNAEDIGGSEDSEKLSKQYQRQRWLSEGEKEKARRKHAHARTTKTTKITAPPVSQRKMQASTRTHVSRLTEGTAVIKTKRTHLKPCEKE